MGLFKCAPSGVWLFKLAYLGFISSLGLPLMRLMGLIGRLCVRICCSQSGVGFSHLLVWRFGYLVSSSLCYLLSRFVSGWLLL